jgi:hypothetical protein
LAAVDDYGVAPGEAQFNRGEHVKNRGERRRHAKIVDGK